MHLKPALRFEECVCIVLKRYMKIRSSVEHLQVQCKTDSCHDTITKRFGPVTGAQLSGRQRHTPIPRALARACSLSKYENPSVCTRLARLWRRRVVRAGHAKIRPITRFGTRAATQRICALRAALLKGLTRHGGSTKWIGAGPCFRKFD